MQVEIRHLEKRFGPTTVLHDVSLHIAEGELCALLGRSGSGKTTLLRILAGLDFPDRGFVEFDGVDVSGRNARDRRIGFVFQHYALFEHMTLSENVAFGLEVKPRRERPRRAAIAKRVEELLELVQLGGYGTRFPDQISGGQRQRVALARALAIEPRMLLLDEPFGALDAKVRKEMRSWLRSLQRKVGLTTIFVTHDQDEALELADRLAILEKGEIVQVGAARDVYDRPASGFVYDFLGGANRLAASVRGGSLIVDGHILGNLAIPDALDAAVLVRAHDFDLSLQRPRNGGLRGQVLDASTGAGTVHVVVQLSGGQRVEVELARRAFDGGELTPAREVWLRPTAHAVLVPGRDLLVHLPAALARDIRPVDASYG